MHWYTIIRFWFEDIDSALWWKKSDEFDDLLRKNFSHWHQAAIRGELAHWRDEPQGRLAEVIILDQFSRNMFRDDPRAFASDPMALTLAQEAIRSGDDKKLTPGQRLFLYMPYMHSESKQIHQQAVTLFTELGFKSNLEFEMKHKAIIDRFGRYPHRNEILGRKSTAEEKLFLQQPNSSF